MTVAELIAKLTELPPDLTVWVNDPEGGFTRASWVDTETFGEDPVVIIE